MSESRLSSGHSCPPAIFPDTTIELTDEVMVACIDYDCCLANLAYRMYACYAWLKFRNEIDLLATAISAGSLSADDLAKVAAIKADIQQVDVTQLHWLVIKADLFAVFSELCTARYAGTMADNLIQEKLADPECFNRLLNLFLSEMIAKMNKIDESLMATILIKANKNLFSYLQAELVETGCKRVAVINFSSRQDYDIDSRGVLLGTGSCFLDLSKIPDQIKATATAAGLKVEAVASDFSMTDIHARQPHGTTFRMIKEQYKNPNENIKHGQTAYDVTKASILYGIVHHLGCMYPSAKFRFYVFDDLESIIDGVYNDSLERIKHGLRSFYTEYLHLITKKSKLKLHVYDGTFKKIFDELEGSGEIDRDYEESLREMARLSLLMRVTHNNNVSHEDDKLDVDNLDIANDLNMPRYFSIRAAAKQSYANKSVLYQTQGSNGEYSPLRDIDHQAAKRRKP